MKTLHFDKLELVIELVERAWEFDEGNGITQCLLDIFVKS